MNNYNRDLKLNWVIYNKQIQFNEFISLLKTYLLLLYARRRACRLSVIVFFCFDFDLYVVNIQTWVKKESREPKILRRSFQITFSNITKLISFNFWLWKWQKMDNKTFFPIELNYLQLVEFIFSTFFTNKLWELSFFRNYRFLSCIHYD